MSSAADSDSHLQSLVLRLGNFHTQMSFLGCIGHLMGGTGLQEAFELVYAENAVVYILNGKAYSRAVRAHLMDAALSATLTSGAFELPWILIHHQADDALLGDESDDSPTLMDTSVAEEVFDMEEIGLLNTDAMANPSTALDTFMPQTGCASSEEIGTSNMEALPQVGHEDLDAAVCLLERLAAGGISAEEAANHDVVSKINKRLEEHKESVSRSRASSLWFQYLDMVGILKKSIKAERTGRFDLHLQSVAFFFFFFCSCRASQLRQICQTVPPTDDGIERHTPEGVSRLPRGAPRLPKKRKILGWIVAGSCHPTSPHEKSEDQWRPYTGNGFRRETASCLASFHACLCRDQLCNADTLRRHIHNFRAVQRNRCNQTSPRPQGHSDACFVPDRQKSISLRPFPQKHCKWTGCR